MKITLPKQLQTKIMEFATSVVKTTFENYKTRGQSNYKKQIQDHYKGKCAEFAVWAWYDKQGIKLDKPDLSVYTKGKKHGADLGDQYHIKTVAKGQVKSWIYQKHCPYLYNGTHIFTVCDGATTEIVYIVGGEVLRDLYSNLLSDELSRTKTAIYAYDLDTIDIKKFIYKGDFR